MKPLVIIMIALQCSSALAKPPAIGDKLPPATERYTIGGNRPWVITDTGASLKTFRITRDGHHYLVGVDQNNTIGYITLEADRTFKTPEGIALGSPLSVVTAVTRHAAIKSAHLACYYFPLPSGWNAAFVGSPEFSKMPGVRPAKVNFLFQSRTAKR